MIRSAVAVIVKNKEILVGKRKRGSRYELKWEFPGGKVEEGESIFQCIKRELSEELSISIDRIDRSITLLNRFEDGGTFEVTCCFIFQFRGTPENKAFEQIRWVSLSDLMNMDTLSANRAFISSLRDADLQEP